MKLNLIRIVGLVAVGDGNPFYRFVLSAATAAFSGFLNRVVYRLGKKGCKHQYNNNVNRTPLPRSPAIS